MHNLIRIFLFGFSSGLPFLLILSTLSVWLAEVGISKTVIGCLALVSVPYSLKFLWGYLVDKLHIPLLSGWLGLRRSWILCAQLLVWFSLFLLGNTDPAHSIINMALFAFLVGCGSAIQDIATEVYRIEILPVEKVGLGASIAVLGYRLGMLCSGAGTLFLATYFNSWSVAYHIIGACMLIGIGTTLLSYEPMVKAPVIKFATLQKAMVSILDNLDWRIIFPFILSYKIADTILNVMSMPFLVEIGFDNIEIASVAKTFGISAMIIGGLVGGFLSSRISLRQNLFICVVLQILASALFVIQAVLGHNLSFLFISMGVENFVCGMSQVALIAYLSHLCAQCSTGIYYGILSSFASFMRVSISVLAGVLADQLSWPQFYIMTCVSCLPSLLLLVIYSKHFIQIDRYKPYHVVAKPQEH